MKQTFRSLGLVLLLCLVLPKVSQAANEVGIDNPTGVTGDYNGQVTTAGSYDPYTGNAKRMVEDIAVPGGIGAYPLKWTRVLNTRNVTAAGSFGSGGWWHSYGWQAWVRIPHEATPGEPNPYEGPDASVTYPDGRTVSFYEQPSGTYLAGGGAEPADGLRDNFDGTYDLLMTDGGKVRFQSYGPGFLLTLVAQYIDDPYLQRTTFTYDTEPGRLVRVTEPGGRYLEIHYNPYLIDYVKAHDGRGNVTQTVNYVYQQISYYNNIYHSYLTQVNYDDNSHATYAYQASNIMTVHSGLIKTCQDVRYAGAMSNIEYEYVPNAAHVDFGQIKAEKNFTTHQALSTVSYPAWNCTPWTNQACYQRTETRADGRTRLFQYGLGGGMLTGYTDFKGNWSFITIPSEPANTNYRKILKDAREYETVVEKERVAGAVKKVTHPDPQHSSVTYTYTDNNNPYYLASRTDENLKTTSYIRNPVTHQVQRVDYPDGGWEVFSYNSFGQVVTRKRSNGVYIAYDHSVYDAWGRLVKRWDATPLAAYPPSDTLPHSTFVYYDDGPSSDRVHVAYDQLNHSTAYVYDNRGNVTRLTHHDNTYIQSKYNPDGTLAWTADENHPGAVSDPNQRVRYTYDEYKRITSVTNLLNEVTASSYDPDPNPNVDLSLSHTTSSVYQTISPMLKKTDNRYDENFRRIEAKQAPGTADQAISSFLYDEVGNLIEVTDPRGKVTRFGFDERNRQTWVKNVELDETTAVEYDAAGNKKKETRPDGSFRTWDHDAMNRVWHAYDWRMSSEAFTVTTTYGHDIAGNLRTITDAKSAIYRYDYDLMNRKTSVTYPSDATVPERTETFHYDDAGNLDYMKNRAGQYKHVHFDTRNRPDHSWWDGDVGPNIETQYDYASRVMGITTNGGETIVAFGYDEANRKIWEDQTVVVPDGPTITHRVQAELDNDGKRLNLKIENPGEGLVISPEMSGSGTYRLEYEYTERNQLKQIQGDNRLWSFQYSYDASGNMTTRQAEYKGLSNSTHCPNYDALNRPTEWEQTGPHGFYARSHHQYDRANREIATWREEEDNKGERFTYEPTNQLSTAAYNGHVASGPPPDATRTVSYTYTADKLNRSSMNDSATGVTTYAPNAVNQYTSVPGHSYTYDDKFNLTHTEGFSGTYDAANHLMTAWNGAAGEAPQTNAEFIYDGLGRCVRRSLNGVGTIFVYDDWKPIGEFDDWNLFQAWNVYGPGADEILLRQQDRYGYTRFQLDRHGNVAFLMDDDGVLIEKYKYDAFGRATVTNGDGSRARTWSYYGHRFLFQGREYLRELGIYDYRNRYYLPATGRFLQTDPTGFDGGDMNLFRYVNDDPIDGSDPTGLYDHRYSRLTCFGGGDWIKDSNGLDAMLFNDKRSSEPAGVIPVAQISPNDEGKKRDRLVLGGNATEPKGSPSHFTDEELRTERGPAAGTTTAKLIPNGNGTTTVNVTTRVRRNLAARDPKLIDREWNHVKEWINWINSMNTYRSDLSTKFRGAPWNQATSDAVTRFLDPAPPQLSRFRNEYTRQQVKYDQPNGPHDIDYGLGN